MPRRSIAQVVVPALLVAVALSACGAGGSGGDGPQVVVRERKDGLLYLGTQTSITAVTPERGAIRFAARGAVPTRDWSALYTTDVLGDTTRLRTLDPETGATRSTRELAGALQVRTVSDDGAVVALMPVQPGVPDAYRAVPRSATDLVIVRHGVEEVQHLTLAANIEPEAFSLSGNTLFVIEYLAAEAPESYRVAALDLATGTVGDVRSSTDELQEPMSGSARAQVLHPTGAGSTRSTHVTRPIRTTQSPSCTCSTSRPSWRPVSTSPNSSRPTLVLRSRSHRRARACTWCHRWDRRSRS